MSAICGILSRDSGRETKRVAIRRMASRMAPIGPDSANIEEFENASVAHLALLVTPEETVRSQPISLKEEGLTIVFDGRIYNREELRRSLPERLDPEVADGMMMLRLYKQMGPAAFAKANAEFALAIYDSRKNELVLARDPVGNRPLYFAETKEFFVFASSTDAIASLDEIASGIDFTTLASYFLYTFELSAGRTLHRSINSVLPCRMIKATRDHLSSSRYYTFKANLDDKSISLDDAIQGLRHHVKRSVDARLRGVSSVGVCLSGGLDSSAVACFAAGSPSVESIASLSALPKAIEHPATREEADCLESVLQAHPRISLNQIDSSLKGPFSDLVEHIGETDEPFGPFYYVMRAFAKLASASSIRTVLTGFGGDALASSKGYGNLYAQIFSDRLTRCPEVLRSGWKRRRSLRSFVSRELMAPLFPRALSFVSSLRNRRTNRVYNSILRSEFLEAEGLKEGFSDPGLSINRVFRNHIESALYVYNNGLSARIPNQWGLAQQCEFLHPLEDLELIEFCLSIPRERYGIGNQPRGLFRAAMADIIPKKVATRSSKSAIAPAFHESLRAEEKQIRQLIDLIGKDNPIWSVVNFGAFQQSLQEALNDDSSYQMSNWNLRPQLEIFPTIAYGLFCKLKF